MTRFAAAAAALLATTSLATAGGIERSNQSMAILFEEGTYLQFGLGHVGPSVSGVGPNVSVSGRTSTGDMAPSYNSPTVSFRSDLTDKLSFGFIIDSHVGADAHYPAGTTYLARGTTAELDGSAFTALLRYEMEGNVSVHGGLRVSDIEGTARIPFVNAARGGYALDVEGGQKLGYVLGAAYEMPEIAMRVALTYNSAITHKLSGTNGPLATPTALPTSFDSTIPQSVMLEAQSGIAANTLLFGSVRWVDWSEFDIIPPLLGGNALVDYEHDTTTYTLGLGRRLNENWSGAVSLVHEKEVGNATDLSPVDGRTGIGLGVTWENERFEVTGGVQYSRLADTDTPALGAAFRDNKTLAAGLRLGFRF